MSTVKVHLCSSTINFNGLPGAQNLPDAPIISSAAVNCCHSSRLMHTVYMYIKLEAF